MVGDCARENESNETEHNHKTIEVFLFSNSE